MASVPIPDESGLGSGAAVEPAGSPPGAGREPAGSPPPLVLVPSGPARRIVLPVEAINAESLGIGELLDMADVLETDLGGLSALMRMRGSIAQSKIVVAFAWILARRLEPGVTWNEAQRWRIEVEGKPPTQSPKEPTPPNDERRGSRPSS